MVTTGGLSWRTNRVSTEVLLSSMRIMAPTSWHRVATAILDLTGGNDGASAMALLWFSALASAVVDNIPYTATAIPVVHRLVAEGVAPDALWWSLALGACLGGNLTIIGASANVVVSDIARRAGHPITFHQFMRYGAGTVAISLVISSVYVWIRYVP